MVDPSNIAANQNISQPQFNQQVAEKTATNLQNRQTGVDMANKLVKPTGEFPADSAFISEEAKRAFEEKDKIRRREEEERKRKQEQQQKKKKNPFLKAYEQQNTDNT